MAWARAAARRLPTWLRLDRVLGRDLPLIRPAAQAGGSGSIAVTGKVEDGDLLAVASALQHLGMAQRAHGVVVAGTPMLRHGQPGELIVFRVTFEASRSIDEVHEVVGVALRDRGKELGFLALFELFR